MKTLIIYTSVHKGNTKKIVKILAKTLNADIKKTQEVDIDILQKYDLIGLGSGIYMGKHHPNLIKLAKQFSSKTAKKVFIFSTSGQLILKNHKILKNLLSQKNIPLAGEFACRGWDCWGPFSIIGGLNKGHPDKKDLISAQKFATNLIP